ncbi:NAD(P)H-dependent oxidoreductase [uncultured Croceitalea sp.]|uniref:NAD(P)H-dependent oxidoreductase n=1 Tax=uncultured Croceitalea sp. TaxID=1798908 RepID=UPI003305F17F
MKVLIIHAHENPDSFCSAMTKTIKRVLEEKGNTVTISDLYAKEFNAAGGKKDFTKLSDVEYYKYASEQLSAHNSNSFIPNLKVEMNALLEADVLVFNFPLWWFGMPAILKGWVDRVFAYGFAYGGEYGFFNTGRFKGKKAFLSITTGSPEEMYTESGAHGRTIDDILKNIHQGILGLVGFEVLPTFVGYGVSRISNKERKKILENYETYLKTHFD